MRSPAFAAVMAALASTTFALLLFVGAHPAGAAPRDDIVVGMAIEPTGLDPTVAAPVAIGQVVWQNVFEGLTRIDETGAVQPQLAKGWRISPDGLVYTFDLQTGAVFHNGKAFDAATAKWTLDRARGEASVNPQKAFFAAIEATEAPDPATLVLRLREPAGNLLYWLGWPASVMVEPGSAATNRSAPVGTGPFRFGEWRHGDRLSLNRNETYWNRNERPVLSSATFRFLSDPQAAAAAIRAGDIDAMPEFGAPELYAEFGDDERLSRVVGVTELKVVAGMNERRPPFDDPRVRKALMMAIDRAALIEGVWAGYGKPIGSHYTPNDPGYVDLTNAIPYDPEGARSLLADAGYPDGFTTSMKTPQMPYATRTAEVLQAFLAEIGVTLNIVPTEFPASWVDQVLGKHDFDMTVIAHAEPMDIAIYARPDYYFGYNNAGFNDAIRAAERATDVARRLTLYGDAQRMLASDVPALYLFALPKLGLWDRRLTGLWTNEPIPSNDLTDVSWSE